MREITQICFDKQLTMKDIAERLGVSETTVYNWEIKKQEALQKNGRKTQSYSWLKGRNLYPNSCIVSLLIGVLF